LELPDHVSTQILHHYIIANSIAFSPVNPNAEDDVDEIVEDVGDDVFGDDDSDVNTSYIASGAMRPHLIIAQVDRQHKNLTFTFILKVGHFCRNL
jgi:hypothetical protein